MFSHMLVGSNDAARALAFYKAVLAPLGVVHYWGEPEGGWLGFHSPDEPCDPSSGKRASFWVGRPIDGAPASAGNGCNVGFTAPSRAAVDAAHAAAMADGGRCEGPPGLRPHYHADWYSCYVRDPDGNKLCIVCQRPE
jgi:catechol 2,3-dioxygenase-like lactoylglutathione lyase family enzyme